MSERSSSVDSNWCHVAQPGASMPPSAHTEALPFEDDTDPALQPLIEKSKSLKETFKQASRSYGSLKKDLRSAGDYFDNAYRHRSNHASQVLGTEEIETVSRDILSEAQRELSAGKYRKQEFFGSYILHHRSVFEQLHGLLGENNALIEDLKRLEPGVEEHQRVVRIDALLHSQKNLNFLINELCEEISAILSWRLDPRR